MKTKLFLAAAAAIALVGCNKEVGNVQPSAAEGPASFLQVDLKTVGDLTKVGNVGDYAYGTAKENAVSSIDFYFFDASGNPYSVVAGDMNTISWSYASATPAENVEAVSDVILVIKQSQQAPPAKVVAVLNSTTSYANKSLSVLASEVVSELHKDGTNFVMSNSVYYDGSAVINATDILSENIFTTTDATLLALTPGQAVNADKVTALGINPISIYVERVAAKVNVTVADEDALPVGEATLLPVDVNYLDKPIYAKILGWEVTNNTDEAYLLKGIDATWADADLGFAWNNAAHYRSYWAATTAEPKHDLTFDQIEAHNPVFDYYFENTAAAAAENGVDANGEAFDGADGSSASNNQAPQLLVAAQLCYADGSVAQLAKWYGVMYEMTALQQAMLNTVASKVYTKTVAEDVTTVNALTLSDVVFQQVAETVADKRYEVVMAVKDGVAYCDSEGNDINAATIFAGVAPAQMWNEGHTYYYLNIKHIGYNADATEQPDGAYGIVRNHCYDVTINGITGLGTPVFDDSKVITPEKPEHQEALNLAAQINILSWHLVSQEVTLQ